MLVLARERLVAEKRWVSPRSPRRAKCPPNRRDEKKVFWGFSARSGRSRRRS